MSSSKCTLENILGIFVEFIIHDITHYNTIRILPSGTASSPSVGCVAVKITACPVTTEDVHAVSFDLLPN